MIRVNIGCGRSPTPGWSNYDGSLAVRLAKLPRAASLGRKLRLLSEPQADNLEFLVGNQIRWADATRHIPFADGSVDVLYASHMLEHLDPAQARAFLSESFRVLKPGGVIRLAVPDLAVMVSNYVDSRDPDRFMEETGLSRNALSTMRDRIQMLLVGDRGHKWMYDGPSICRTLERAGFVDVAYLEAGETRITDPGRLDLAERSGESVYAEAIRP